MPEITIPNGWRPRPYQMPLWRYLERGGKRAYPVWHRRSGKDDVALNWTCVSAIQKPATYWHMLPEASQARKAIWDAVNPATGIRRIDQAFPMAIRAAIRENEMFIRFINGATWQVVGSDNFDSLVGSPPYGIVFSEWALSKPNAWSFLAPILRENGGWALFITTPRGDNHAGLMYKGVKDDPEWFCETQTAEDTGVFSASDLVKERIDLDRVHGPVIGGAIFEQEYMCSFEPPTEGTYFQRAWFDAARYDRLPANLHFYMTSDHARTEDGGDYTVLRIWGIDTKSDMYFVDGWRGQKTPDAWANEAVRLIKRYKPLCWFAENDTIWGAVSPFVRRVMRDSGVECRIETLSTRGDKDEKTQSFQGMAAAGRVHLPWSEEADTALGEYLAFPFGRNDDEVDVGANMGRALMDAHPAIVQAKVLNTPRFDAWGMPSRDAQTDWRAA